MPERRCGVTTRDLCFVIPVHNRREFTRNCLAALAKQETRIIVVDDGSTDGTEAMIRCEFPEVTVLRGDGNLWWSGATNLGAKHGLELGAACIVCLNDDTLPQPDFARRLAEAASQMPNTIIGAMAVDARTGCPIFGGERMNWLAAAPYPLLPKTGAPPEGIVEVSHAPGRGLLIPAAVFRRAGFFDADCFPQYAADYDFTSRARSLGFRVVCYYPAVLGIYPEASGDAANRSRRSFANYWQHLSGVKGGANLAVFVRYAGRHCPLALLPSCLVIGVLRRIGGYPAAWIRERVVGWRRWNHAGHEA